jgi:hypothetical protein
MTLPVLYRDFFQFGYVVRDLDGAMRTMRDKFGVARWKIRHLPDNAPGRTLAFAYINGVMVELVDLRPGDDTIYHAWIPEADDALRLHHLGFLIDEESEWNARIAQYEASGFKPSIAGEIPDCMVWYYSDTVSALGHYTELIRFTSEAGKAYWADVPHN